MYYIPTKVYLAKHSLCSESKGKPLKSLIKFLSFTLHRLTLLRYKILDTSNMTAHHRGPKPKLRAGYRAFALGWLQSTFIKTGVLFVVTEFNGCHIFHCWVWYASIWITGIILIHWATFVPNLVSFVASIAELAHGEKLRSQSIAHPAYLMPQELKLSLRKTYPKISKIHSLKLSCICKSVLISTIYYWYCITGLTSYHQQSQAQ